MKDTMEDARSYGGQIDDVLIDTGRGLITARELDMTIDEYVSNLRNPDDIYNNKPMIYNGLLESIYRRNIRHILPKTYNNDYELLDQIFKNIYLYLCYIFNYVPNISAFCNHLVHIDISNCYNINTGFYRKDGSKVNINTYNIYKNWQRICDGDLFGHIVHTGSVGGIFTAKVKGYSDAPQNVAPPALGITPQLSESQLASVAGMIAPEIPAKDE